MFHTYIRRAPELWGVGQDCGPASDVWAAGVMMYQLLSTRYPFWDTPASSVDRLPLYQVMLAVTSNPIHMNGPEWDSVSRQAKDLVMAMLGKGNSGEAVGGREKGPCSERGG